MIKINFTKANAAIQKECLGYLTKFKGINIKANEILVRSNCPENPNTASLTVAERYYIQRNFKYVAFVRVTSNGYIRSVFLMKTSDYLNAGGYMVKNMKDEDGNTVPRPVPLWITPYDKLATCADSDFSTYFKNLVLNGWKI